MAEVNEEEVLRLKAKRKRIARMKKMIIFTIVFWMLGSLIAIILLGLRVVSLQKQINHIVERRSIDNQINASSDSYVTENDFVLYTSLDNIAEAGDIPRVYLTFDDGPSARTTEVLDILDDNGIKATFFVIGREDEESLELYRRIVDEGHTIGIHSYTHKYGDLYASKDDFIADYKKISDLVYNATGVRPKYYRFPGGSSNLVSSTDMQELMDYLAEQGVEYYDWNVASGDATSQAFTTNELVENVMSDVVKYKTSVVLMHDSATRYTTVAALPELIRKLQDQGAMILPITEDTMVIHHNKVNK